jgi:hypothetical protein
MGAQGGNRAVAEGRSMKRRQYYKRPIKRHYGGELRGHAQPYRQRARHHARPANPGRRLDAAERQAIEQRMRDEGRL